MNDLFRQTGRTTNNLIHAINKFNEGFDVIVTGWSQTYSYDLQNLSIDIMIKNGIDISLYKISKGKIHNPYQNNNMYFDSHKNVLNYGPMNAILLFPDHFQENILYETIGYFVE